MPEHVCESGGGVEDPCVGFPGDPGHLQPPHPLHQPSPDLSEDTRTEPTQLSDQYDDPYLDPSLPCLDPASTPAAGQGNQEQGTTFCGLLPGRQKSRRVGE